MNKGTITINRESAGYTDLLRAYAIWIDGNLVGKIGRGGSQVVEVQGGEHEVRLKIDWCCSPSIQVTLAAGENVELSAAPNAHPLTVLYYVTFGRKRYIRLSRVSE
jgi:hypothetical protein